MENVGTRLYNKSIGIKQKLHMSGKSCKFAKPEKKLVTSSFPETSLMSVCVLKFSGENSMQTGF